jgi:putrescine aminotransferase
VGRVGTLCRDHCFDNGLVMRAVRDAMVLSPPLILTREQIDGLIDLARHCLDLTAKDMGR